MDWRRIALMLAGGSLVMTMTALSEGRWLAAALLFSGSAWIFAADEWRKGERR